MAQILVRAGIGRLLLLDYKTVDAPDLNRQALYTVADIGKPKIEIAAQRLTAMTTKTELLPLSLTIGSADCAAALSRYSFAGIADCLDNYASRFALETLLTEEIFLVHGGVQQEYGQLTTICPGQTASLQILYAGCERPESEPLPVCPEIAFCVGSLMAAEIRHNLWHTPELLNTFLIVELSDFSLSKIPLAPPSKTQGEMV